MHSLAKTIRAATHAICATFEKIAEIQFDAPWHPTRCRG